MRKTYSVKPKPSLKRGTDVRNFNLLRTREQAPIIVSQPVDTVVQTKYVFPNGTPHPVTPLNDVVYLLKNTPFTVTVVALDPSNILDITSTSELTYQWKLNDNDLYGPNNQNKGKGIATLQYAAKDVTIDLSGVFTCEITNEYGTTVTTPMTLQVVDPELTPLYYANLINNGSGEAGVEGWSVSEQIQTSEFNNGILDSDNFATINSIIGAVSDPDDLSIYEQKRDVRSPFKFCKSSNWANFERFRTDASFGQNYGWWWRYQKPNLIQNEHPWDPYASFFPSLQYVDEFNENQNKPGLKASFSVFGSYFGRKELGFARDGEPSTATMTQTINLIDYQAYIDGYVNGIDATLGRFFCYVGVGLDKYEYKLTVSSAGQAAGNGGVVPQNLEAWQALYDMLLLQPFTNEAIAAEMANEAYAQAGGIFVPASPVDEIGQARQYNTFILSIADLVSLVNNQQYNKLDFSSVTRIDLIPKVHNKVDITIEAALEDGTEQVIATINGPGEAELMAVKEKALLSYMIRRTLDRSVVVSSLKQKIGIYLLDKKLCEIGSNATSYNEAFVKEQLQSYPQEYYSLSKTTIPDAEIGSDRGVQAFFAIGANFSVPKLTRSLRVKVNMRHESRAYNNQNPETGIVSWEDSTLYAEHTGEVDSNGLLYKASTPKVGITQMKLCLYDNVYSRGPVYPTYFIPPNNTLNESQKYINVRGFDDSQAASYKYIGKPTSFTYTYPTADQLVEKVPLETIRKGIEISSGSV